MSMENGYRHRYRLPASLGGMEYEGVVNGAYVLLDVPGVGAVPFEAGVVTRVVPEEPEDGSFVAIVRGEAVGDFAAADDDYRPRVYSRHDDPIGEVPGAAHWWWHDQQQWCTWEDVYTRGVPRLLAFSGLLIRSGAARGWCSVCESSRPMRVDGKLKEHGPRHAPCKGSHKYPAGDPS